MGCKEKSCEHVYVADAARRVESTLSTRLVSFIHNPEVDLSGDSVSDDGDSVVEVVVALAGDDAGVVVLESLGVNGDRNHRGSGCSLELEWILWGNILV